MAQLDPPGVGQRGQCPPDKSTKTNKEVDEHTSPWNRSGVEIVLQWKCHPLKLQLKSLPTALHTLHQTQCQYGEKETTMPSVFKKNHRNTIARSTKNWEETDIWMMGKIKLIEAARFKGRVSGVGDCVAGAQIIWSKYVQRKCTVSFSMICTFSSNLDDFHPSRKSNIHTHSPARPPRIICMWRVSLSKKDIQ